MDLQFVDVQETALVTLAIRASETARPNPRIRDEKAKEIIASASETARQNLNEKKIEMIAQGRLNKYFKEVCLLDQAYIDDNKISVADYLKAADKELTVVDFKRYTLRAE